jgi:lipoprotein-anchoring transpeptidase ErfK/SrfK
LTSNFYVYDGSAYSYAASCGAISFSWGDFMGFGAGIRTLQVIIAFLLMSAVPGMAGAQASGQTQPAPIQQGQPPEVVPADAALTTPPAQTQSVAAPPAATPPTVKPPIATPAPKPRKKGPVDALKPGQFIWVKQDVYEGPMKIVVVLDTQRIYVFQNEQLFGFSTISSGKKGKETPTGIFNILQKNVDHKSNLYSNAPMPFMQRLTWDGIAVHGGDLPGYPASHGCIRLPMVFAKALFGVTKMGQEVVVLKDTSTPVKRPEPPPAIDTEVGPADAVADPALPPPVVAPKPADVFPPEPSV